MATASDLLAGVMSGTSADGVDAAVVRVGGIGGEAPAVDLLAHYPLDYESDLRSRIFLLREGGSCALAELAAVGRGISLAYVAAVRGACAAAGVTPGELSAVAAHGQTLYHQPPDTIQWLDPPLVAAELGCRVISDFRRADCAAGGQGAPLVPFADYVLFRHPTKSRVLLNIGGIANLTYLRAGGSIDEVIAFDTGPGNCISDYLMRAIQPQGPAYDACGAIAARGVPIYPLLQLVLQDEYFSKPPPKSTDGPQMIELFRSSLRQLERHFPPEYLVRTACLLTATTIADAMRRFLDPFPDELIVSGGGVYNETMMQLLRQPLGQIPILRTDDLGIPAQAKEAVAFAILGAATLHGVPSNVPAATGAKRAVMLGSVTPKP